MKKTKLDEKIVCDVIGCGGLSTYRLTFASPVGRFICVWLNNIYRNIIIVFVYRNNGGTHTNNAAVAPWYAVGIKYGILFDFASVGACRKFDFKRVDFSADFKEYIYFLAVAVPEVADIVADRVIFKVFNEFCYYIVFKIVSACVAVYKRICR